MPWDLLVETAGHNGVFVAALGMTAILASVLRTWIVQASRTRRLTRALADSAPTERAEIIAACGQLEQSSHGEPSNDKAPVGLPPAGHLRPQGLTSQTKRK